MQVREVEQVEELTAAKFQADYVARGRPVVVRNEAALCDLPRTWSLDLLAAKHAQHLLPVTYYPSGNRWDPGVRVRMDFARYLAHQRGGALERKQYYLGDQPLAEIFPALAREVRMPAWLEGQPIAALIVFTGIDTFTQAHYHRRWREALLMHIVGRKRVRLCSPQQFRSMYPKPLYSFFYNSSQLPFDGADYEVLGRRYPRLAAALIYECTLEAGDALFIPQGWFHAVEGLGESLSATYFLEGNWRHGYLPLIVREHLWQAYMKHLAVPLLRLGSKLPLTQRYIEKYAPLFAGG